MLPKTPAQRPRRRQMRRVIAKAQRENVLVIAGSGIRRAIDEEAAELLPGVRRAAGAVLLLREAVERHMLKDLRVAVRLARHYMDRKPPMPEDTEEQRKAKAKADKRARKHRTTLREADYVAAVELRDGFVEPLSPLQGSV